MQKKQQGFTLIEAVIVMTIFLFTIGAVISIFLSIISNQRGILAQQKAFNQLSYIQEYMSKALRMAKADTDGSCLEGSNETTGYVYLLTRPDLATGQYGGIKFINQSDNDACTEFFLDHSDSQPILKELKDSTNDADAVSLSSSQLLINGMLFAINGQVATVSSGITGALDTDGVQPKLTIGFNVDIGQEGQTQDKTFQTTISERNLNVAP